MAEESGIAWTDATFNLWIGCTKVSPGCKFCYAKTLDDSGRFGESHWGAGAPRKRLSEHYWNDPKRWERKAVKEGKRKKVFCSSLADVFDEEGYEDERARLWELTKVTPSLDWLVLTKRPQNFKYMLPKDWNEGYSNVWLGITTEDQETANNRIPILSETRSKIKWLSVEPQIEDINFSSWMEEEKVPFNWMIFGGESGSDREFNPMWMKLPIYQAKQKNVAVFIKQMGTVWAKANGVQGKAERPDEWPEWCRIREFPKV